MQDSVAEVETLLRKQEQFEEVLEAQAEQLDEVEGLAQELIQQKHFDSDNIRSRSRALALRYLQGAVSAELLLSETHLIDTFSLSVCEGGASCCSRVDLAMKLWRSHCSSSSSSPAAVR